MGKIRKSRREPRTILKQGANRSGRELLEHPQVRRQLEDGRDQLDELEPASAEDAAADRDRGTPTD